MVDENHAASIVDVLESIIVQQDSTKPSWNNNQDVSHISNLKIEEDLIVPMWKRSFFLRPLDVAFD